MVTDHPVVISGDATKDIMNIQKWISLWLKENFLNKEKSLREKNIKKIYIDRSNKNLKTLPQRILKNEDEIKKYLLKNNFISVNYMK